MKVLRFVALFAMVLVQQALAATTKTPKTTTTTFPPNPKDCSKVDMRAYPEKCCEEPCGPLAADKYLKKCSTDKKMYLWINSFQLNQLQNPDIENRIDMKTTAKRKIACNAARFVNCVFETHTIMNKAFTVYNGTAGMVIVNATVPNRPTNWIGEIQYIEQEDALQLVDERWNSTITCPALNSKKKGDTEEVFIGNLNLMQSLQMHLSYSCQKPVTETTKNKCLAHAVNFGFCVDKVYEDFDAKKVNKPEWMMDLNKKDRKIVDMLLRIARK